MGGEDRRKRRVKKATVADRVPKDPWLAFAWFVSRCGEGFGEELIAQGKTATEARNIIIHCFLDFAAGEACRLARGEQREPDPNKWQKAADDAFARAVKRTASSSHPDRLRAAPSNNKTEG